MGRTEDNVEQSRWWIAYALGCASSLWLVAAYTWGAACTSSGCVEADCFYTSNGEGNPRVWYELSTTSLNSFADPDPTQQYDHAVDPEDEIWKKLGPSSNCTRVCTNQARTEATCKSESSGWTNAGTVIRRSCGAPVQ